MTKLLSALGLALVALSASCYSPDLSGVKYACDEVNPYCPDGLECISGVCSKPGTGTEPPPMQPSDGGAPLAGCRFAGGTDLGGGVFACPGEFNRNRSGGRPIASELCAIGASICSSPKTADMAKCNSLPGFFAGTQPARYDGRGSLNDPNNYDCQQADNPGNRAVAGCGRLARDQIVAKTCGNFSRVLQCFAVQSWTCNSDLVDDSHDNSNAQDGVLCCLP
ncbi:MAG: hypothetical protein JNJ46_11755 [Myxococcales bacterium]|nr:hypothetical protein [Myxococcales bacterium]